MLAMPFASTTMGPLKVTESERGMMLFPVTGETMAKKAMIASARFIVALTNHG